MIEPSREEITGLLEAWRRGEDSALDRLIPLAHRELHRLAHHYMSQEQSGHTLQSTALVNELYIRLLDCARVGWRDRVHFFSVCAHLLRRILIDHARSQRRLKRGGGAQHIPLDESRIASDQREIDFLALDQSLKNLEKLDSRKARTVELLFFGGMTVEEAAEVLGVSGGTVKRDWSFARAWIFRELSRNSGGAE